MMRQCLSVLLVASASLWIPQAAAQTAPAKPKIVKKVLPAKKTAVKKTDPADSAALDEDDKAPDIAGSSITEFHCELGNSITLYRNADDDRHIALRWKKVLHRMTRVGTSTGANRFENRKFGLVWIGIPAKSILLDSKKGLQLANECKSAEQNNPEETPKT